MTDGPRVPPGHVPADIDVIVVTATGSQAVVSRCLEALRDCDSERCRPRVTVVDNASTDGVVGLIRERFPAVAVIPLDGNRGFAAGVNAGIRATSSEWVLLLNPDTELTAAALRTLWEAIAGDPAAAVVGPRLVDRAGQPDHNAKRAFPSPAAALRHFIGLSGGRPAVGSSYARTDVGFEDRAAVDAVSGSCMLVRRAAIGQVGLLDEGYWMYGEDLDWCRRFGLAGWRIGYVGDAVVLHVKHGVSGPARSLRLNWAFHRAMGRFYRRYEAGVHPALDWLVYLGILVKFGASALTIEAARRFASLRRNG